MSTEAAPRKENEQNPLHSKQESKESINSDKTLEISKSVSDTLETQPNGDHVVSIPKFNPEEIIYLEHEWAFWFDSGRIRGMNQTSYENSLKIIGTFGTVQDFWRFWNNFTDINKFPDGSNLLLFKLGIKPMWEDPSNEKGGKYVINSDKRHILESWLRIMLFTVGEQFSNPDELCGLVLSVRSKGDTIKIWNRSADNPQETSKMNDDIRRCLSLPQNYHIPYQIHMGPMEHNNKLISNKQHRRRSSRENSKKKSWDKSSSFNEEDNDRLVRSMDTLSTHRGLDEGFPRTSPRVSEKKHQSFSRNHSIDHSASNERKNEHTSRTISAISNSLTPRSSQSAPNNVPPSETENHKETFQTNTTSLAVDPLVIKTAPQERKSLKSPQGSSIRSAPEQTTTSLTNSVDLNRAQDFSLHQTMDPDIEVHLASSFDVADTTQTPIVSEAHESPESFSSAPNASLSPRICPQVQISVSDSPLTRSSSPSPALSVSSTCPSPTIAGSSTDTQSTNWGDIMDQEDFINGPVGEKPKDKKHTNERNQTHSRAQPTDDWRRPVDRDGRTKDSNHSRGMNTWDTNDRSRLSKDKPDWSQRSHKKSSSFGANTSRDETDLKREKERHDKERYERQEKQERHERGSGTGGQRHKKSSSSDTLGSNRTVTAVTGGQAPASQSSSTPNAQPQRGGAGEPIRRGQPVPRRILGGVNPNSNSPNSPANSQKHHQSSSLPVDSPANISRSSSLSSPSSSNPQRPSKATPTTSFAEAVRNHRRSTSGSLPTEDSSTTGHGIQISKTSETKEASSITSLSTHSSIPPASTSISSETSSGHSSGSQPSSTSTPPVSSVINATPNPSAQHSTTSSPAEPKSTLESHTQTRSGAQNHGGGRNHGRERPNEQNRPKEKANRNNSNKQSHSSAPLTRVAPSASSSVPGSSSGPSVGAPVTTPARAPAPTHTVASASPQSGPSNLSPSQSPETSAAPPANTPTNTSANTPTNTPASTPTNTSANTPTNLPANTPINPPASTTAKPAVLPHAKQSPGQRVYKEKKEYKQVVPSNKNKTKPIVVQAGESNKENHSHNSTSPSTPTLGKEQVVDQPPIQNINPISIAESKDDETENREIKPENLAENPIISGLEKNTNEAQSNPEQDQHDKEQKERDLERQKQEEDRQIFFGAAKAKNPPKRGSQNQAKSNVIQKQTPPNNPKKEARPATTAPSVGKTSSSGKAASGGKKHNKSDSTVVATQNNQVTLIVVGILAFCLVIFVVVTYV